MERILRNEHETRGIEEVSKKTLIFSQDHVNQFWFTWIKNEKRLVGNGWKRGKFGGKYKEIFDGRKRIKAGKSKRVLLEKWSFYLKNA